MTIAPFAAGSYASDRTTQTLVGLKGRLDTLSTQLATGRTAETYAGLGAGRVASLSAHAAVGALDGYVAAIDGNMARVGLASQSLTQVKTLGDALSSSLLAGGLSTTATGIGNVAALARSSLDGTVDALDQQIAGQFLFGGRATDASPVVSSALMLDGDPAQGLAGLRTLIAEQTRADLGAAGNGRLTQALTGTTVSLSEDPSAQARANLGYRLVAARSSSASAGTGIAATLTAGAPATVDLAFAAQPSEGDRVRVAVLGTDGGQTILDLTARRTPTAGESGAFAIGATPAETAANLKAALGGAAIASVQSASPPGVSATFSGGTPAALGLDVGTPTVGDTLTLTLGLRDGTTQTITLTAAAGTDAAAAGRYAIGASPAETAANLSAALANALQGAARTGLTASSAVRAAGDFFDGSSSPGLAPRRIAAGGDGYAQTAQPSTVIWYRGEDAAGDPRAGASVQVGANRSVAIGARANEPALRASLTAFAALAAADVRDASGVNDVARFRAVADRAQALLDPADGTGGVADIAGAFGLAAGSMADAKTGAQTAKTTLLASLDGVETVSTAEVASRLLTLQNQLQASYQVTSMLSKLSLVNYLS